MAPPPSIRTGERSENSVLFSVDVLRKAASSAPPPPPVVQSRPQDDDGAGTIDLNALAQATGGSLAYKPLTLSEPPMAAFAQDVGGPLTSHGRSSGSRTRMYVAGGAVAAFAVLGAVAIAATTGGEGDKATASHVSDSARGTGLDAAFAPVRSGAQAAAPASDAADHTSAKIASGRSGKGGATFASSYRPSSTPSRSTPPPAAKSGGAKPTADRCGCHGVLACVIRCSATGK